MNSLIIVDNDGLYIENEKTQKNDKKLGKLTKKVVKKMNIVLKNEIIISDKITKIPRFFLYFDPILSYREFKLAEIDENRFEKCKPINKSSEYFLLNYENREKIVEFFDFFQKNRENKENSENKVEKKKIILKIINAFKNFLKTLNILHEQNIVHMNITYRTIFFEKDESPILTDFSKSFVLNEETLDEINFSEYNPKNINLPIEAHLLCFMNEKEYTSLSAINIETVLSDYNRAISLSPFGEYINSTSIFSQTSLINKPKREIKKKLLSTAHTWNNYSLSINFLYVLSSLYNSEAGSDIFLKNFVNLLLNNISVDYSMREDLDKTQQLFDELLYSISKEDWCNIII
jgi:hypothetical protein